MARSKQILCEALRDTAGVPPRPEQPNIATAVEGGYQPPPSRVGKVQISLYVEVEPF